MAITSKLQVVTKDSNNKELNRTVSYVNPETSDSDLTRFATAYTGLSRRTYKEFYRVDREDITDAAPEVPRIPTFNSDTGVVTSVTSQNGVLKFTSPWFTAANEAVLKNKMICNIVNSKYSGKNSGLKFEHVTQVELVDSNYFIYGTLDDGSVSNAENAYTSGYYITTSKLTRNGTCVQCSMGYALDESNYTTFAHSTVDKDFELTDEDFITKFAAGTLSIASCIADLNALLATDFNGNNLGGVPTFAYDAAAGSITLTPSFTVNTVPGFIMRTEDNPGNILLQGLIGASVIAPYVDPDDEVIYYYKVDNPNYSA